ncbi:alpha-ribazole phosphatase family protein [Amaricoccus macauensis]|uniref:alpha-ribazole phosphatase family protein n=1 Tax=Amaricoccus macauensis TaxID=57001 RepID=UPI003C798D48
MPLIVLRHTKPDVAPGTCYGRTDLALATCFEETARAAHAGLPPVARIVSSPLSRCLRLAEWIAQARNLPLEIDPRIVEMDFGRWEGTPWAEISRPELDAWAADFEGARPHGGESVAMLAERVSRALEGLGPEPTLWVTHSGVFRAVCAIRGIDDGWDTQLDFGCWVSVEP